MMKSVLILGALLWSPLNAMYVAQLSSDTSREISLVQVAQETIKTNVSEEDSEAHSQPTSKDLAEDISPCTVSFGVKAMQSLFGYVKSTLKSVSEQPMKALTILLALQNKISGAAAITVTNKNQNLIYMINGPAVQLLPITVRGTAFPCNATIKLGDMRAGDLSSTGVSTVTPTFSSGVWEAIGGTLDLSNLLSSLVFTPATDYSDTIYLYPTIFDVFTPTVKTEGTIKISPSISNIPSTSVTAQSPSTTTKSASPTTQSSNMPSTSLTIQSPSTINAATNNVPSSASTSSTIQSPNKPSIPQTNQSPSIESGPPATSPAHVNQNVTSPDDSFSQASNQGHQTTIIPFTTDALFNPQVTSESKPPYAIIGGIVGGLVGVCGVGGVGGVVFLVYTRGRESSSDQMLAQENGAAINQPQPQNLENGQYVGLPISAMKPQYDSSKVPLKEPDSQYDTADKPIAGFDSEHDSANMPHAGMNSQYDTPDKPITGFDSEHDSANMPHVGLNSQYDVVNAPRAGLNSHYDVLNVARAAVSSKE